MRSSVGHGYAGIQKFDTLMDITKTNDCKNYNKKI